CPEPGFGTGGSPRGGGSADPGPDPAAGTSQAARPAQAAHPAQGARPLKGARPLRGREWGSRITGSKPAAFELLGRGLVRLGRALRRFQALLYGRQSDPAAAPRSPFWGACAGGYDPAGAVPRHRSAP